jgi:stage II sporulation protein D
MGGCRTSSRYASLPTAQVVSTADRRIRVRLDQGARQFALAVESRCVIDDDRGHPLVEPLSSLSKCVVLPDPDDPNCLILGDVRLRYPVMRVLPHDDGSLVYNGRYYRGYLVAKREGDTMLVINVLDVESYLRGVLQAELPKWFHPETFHVQAIVSRTYALYQRYLNGKDRPWDVTATTSSQVYHGVDGESLKANQAVDATSGLVCAWDSPKGRKIFCTYFSSTCGGMNQDVVNVKGGQSIPPLSGGVTCEHCKRSDWFRWPKARLSKDRITRDVKPWLVNGGWTGADKVERIEDIKIISRTKNGRAIRLRLIDRGGRAVDMRAEDFRLLIDNGRLIKSTLFEVQSDASTISFINGRGYGHGIGLCQYGAEGMARRGMKAGKILQHYYPGCVLVKAY